MFMLWSIYAQDGIRNEPLGRQGRYQGMCCADVSVLVLKVWMGRKYDQMCCKHVDVGVWVQWGKGATFVLFKMWEEGR